MKHHELILCDSLEHAGCSDDPAVLRDLADERQWSPAARCVLCRLEAAERLAERLRELAQRAASVLKHAAGAYLDADRAEHWQSTMDLAAELEEEATP